MSSLHFPLPTAVSSRIERFGVRILTLLALGLPAGCAHSEPIEERQLAKMREELTRIQTEHDALDRRVDAIELHTGAGSGDEADPSSSPSVRSAASNDASTIALPKLRVVRLDSAGNPADQEPQQAAQ
ncbi:MAG: hypothetical protein ABI551_24855, partial [Polyangiaceae bacterium]